MVVASKRWVQKMLDADGVMMFFKKTALRPGFLEIHTRRKIADAIAWAMPDNMSDSWANTMAQRYSLLRRHVSQAMEGDNPSWLSMIFDKEIKAVAEYVSGL